MVLLLAAAFLLLGSFPVTAQEEGPEDFVPDDGALVPAALTDSIAVDTVSGGDLGSVNVAQPALDQNWVVQFQTGMNATTHFRLRHTGAGGPVNLEAVRLEGANVADFRVGFSFELPCTLREEGGQPPSDDDPCIHSFVDVRVGFKPGATGNRTATLVFETDQGDITRTLTGRGVTGSILYRINSGGPTLHDPDRGQPSYGEDLFQNASAYLIRLAGSTGPDEIVDVSTDASVPSATPVELFQRWRVGADEIRYAFPTVAPGAHVVRLYFAELSTINAGARLIDVDLEGNRVLGSFDVLGEAGFRTGTARAFRVESDDVLNVVLGGAEGSPVVQGVEIREVDGASAAGGEVTGNDFGPVAIGGTATRTVLITNAGGPAAPSFRVDGFSLSGSGASDASHDFAGPVWVGPGRSHEVEVSLSPSGSGDRSVGVTAALWAAPDLATTLEGSGVTPAGRLEAPPALDLGSVRVGSVGEANLTLTNPSGDEVFVSDADVIGSPVFSVEEQFPLSLAPGASANLTVRFAPSAVAPARATLRIEHTGTNRPSEVALSGTGLARFVDTAGSIFQADIDWMAQQEITRGCNPPANDRFCPEDFVTRGQMAAFFVRALGLTDAGGGDRFVDDDGSVFEGDIDRMSTAGITRGCNPPANDRFCPEDFVTRGQMAAFFHRAAALMGLPG